MPTPFDNLQPHASGLRKSRLNGSHRILVISPIGCGPPHSGNRSRMRALLQELRGLGYEIHFAWAQIPDDEAWGRLSNEARQETVQYVDQWVHDFLWPSRQSSGCRVLLEKLRHGLVRLTRRGRERRSKGIHRLDQWFHSGWIREARDLQRRFDYSKVIVAYVFCSAFFKAFPATTLKVLDCHDAFTCRNDVVSTSEENNWWYAVYRTDERRGLMRSDRILGIQEHESEFFRQLTNRKRPVYSVGHFTDVRALPFDNQHRDVIGFIGSDTPTNADGLRWFIDEVFPLVAAQCPSSKLLLAGAVSLSITSPPPEYIILGKVDEVSEVYSRILFAINPVRHGTGLKIKTVESLAHGRAVVATPSGSSGLEAYAGRGLEPAATAGDFASAILTMLEDPELAMQRGRMAAEVATELNERSRESLSRALSPAA
jgi:polysaccharide biosynthesis protein PslH